MKISIKYLTSILSIFFIIELTYASSTNDEFINMIQTDDQEEIRVNPSIVIDTAQHPLAKEYSYLILNKNYITYNNADWSSFYNKLLNASSQISIVHIGDSHLQADIATAKTRALFQEKYGDAGRGLISPLKMAKTNEPIDYYFKCNTPYVASSLMRRPWKSNIRLTGASFTPTTENFQISVGTKKNESFTDTFSKLRIHVDGDLYIDSVRADNRNISYTIDETSPYYTDIYFSRPVSNVDLWLSSIGKIAILGTSLLNDSNGVVYNVIGNNGASYYSYNKMGNLGSDCTFLNPDLFIISLGANEAFGNLSNEGFYDTVSEFIQDIQSYNPNVPILLVTPMECQKNGRINQKIKQFRNVFILFGKDKNIAVYDWYEVAGGDNASSKWVKDRLMGGDRIHNTSKGYYLQGTLLFEALTNDIIN